MSMPQNETAGATELFCFGEIIVERFPFTVANCSNYGPEEGREKR